MNSVEVANLFKTLSDKNRLEIVLLLQNGEMCACDLLENLDISQSTLSHHMKILLMSEIVLERKNSKWSFYSINNDKLEQVKTIIDSFSCKENSNSESDHCK